MLHGMTTTTIYDEYGIFNRLMIDHTAVTTMPPLQRQANIALLLDNIRMN